MFASAEWTWQAVDHVSINYQLYRDICFLSITTILPNFQSRPDEFYIYLHHSDCSDDTTFWMANFNTSACLTSFIINYVCSIEIRLLFGFDILLYVNVLMTVCVSILADLLFQQIKLKVRIK